MPAVKGARGSLSGSVNTVAARGRPLRLQGILEPFSGTVGPGGSGCTREVGPWFQGNQQKADQMRVAGHGNSSPLYSTATPAGRQRNERIEIVIYPDPR